MKLVDWIFVTLYAFLERTPLRGSAKEAAAIYTGYTLWVHGFMILFGISRIVGVPPWPNLPIAKPFVLGTVFGMFVVMFWIYCWRDRGGKVATIERSRHAPIVGMLLFVEAHAGPVILFVAWKWFW
ncbi:MAG: hypothetical protein KF724_13835 [Phycisphaeraceae bacterium]|nr:hypothetical protein [Phycisphaeraceae bacterium]MBX3356769.1 hypothetical protein [Phycisphaeraceae bacterium]